MFQVSAWLLDAVAEISLGWTPATGTAVYVLSPVARLCATLGHLLGLGGAHCGLKLQFRLLQVCTAEPRGKAFRHFLDGSQYQVTGILRYEKIFGEGYVSTGGAETTKVGTGYRLADTWEGSLRGWG